MDTLLKFLLALVLLISAAGLGIWRDAEGILQAPLPITQKQRFEIPQGGSLILVLADLQAQNLIAEPRLPLYLRAYTRIMGLTASLKAGEYELVPGMSSLDMLMLFVSGKTVLHDLRLLEGWTFAQALAAVHENEELLHTLADESPEAVMQAIGRQGQHPEGRFFPDTYHFPKGTTDVAFLRRAYAAMENALNLEWARRAPDLPYRSAGEALIMASIVEKETGAAGERAQVAGVFVNRLRLGMKLQTDPTVIYGLGKDFDGNLRRKDLEADNPYNTYTRTGLPPTPICLPGRAAIRAALHPADTKALFFVARRDGTHQFSETLEAHNAAVNEFQKKRHGRK